MRLIECNRGQTVMSLRNWADRWKVSRDTTRNFLELLKKRRNDHHREPHKYYTVNCL